MIDLNTLPLPTLFEELARDGSVERLIAAALAEDAPPPGDITTLSVISEKATGRAMLVAREPGTIAGLEILPYLIRDQPLEFRCTIRDGHDCRRGMSLALIGGSLRRLLTIERTLLNIVGRLSGIATLTRRFVDAIAGTRAVICDTRKTTPGMRSLEKYAVRCGGGTLHRAGLHDAALYKDNHLAAIGGITSPQGRARLRDAIVAVRQAHDLRFVEVEVDRLQQLEAVLALEPHLVDIVLLDNMAPDDLRQAVAMRDARQSPVQLEASGGVNLRTVRAIAESGVDRISVGALTHSTPSLDVGLDLEMADE